MVDRINFKFLVIIISLIFLISMIPYSHAMLENGSMKIFAVNSSGGAMQANLSIRIIPGSGKIYSSIDSLVGNTTQESEKNAVLAADQKVKGIKDKYDFFFDIESNAYSIDGPSAGGAMALTLISMLEDKNLSSDVSMTGTISPDGHIGDVGGIYEKAKKAAEVGIKLFMIPSGNRQQMVKEEGNIGLIDLVDFAYNEWGMKIVEVSTIDDVLDYAFKDINTIDINSTTIHKKEIYNPEKIDYALGLKPMKNLLEKYLVDANVQLNRVEKEISDSKIKDTSILQNMLTAINSARDSYDRAKVFAEDNYLYSAANNAFIVLVNTNTIDEILTNPSILSEKSVIFDLKLEDLEKKIQLTENRAKLCSLDKLEWCIGAKQRITWARNKLESLKKDKNNSDFLSSGTAVSKITDYSYALAWTDIANDFLDIGITNSDVKFVESDYFKDKAQQYLVKIENKLIMLDPSYSTEEDIQRRLTAAKSDMDKGWYVTSMYDAASVMGVIVSKEQNDQSIFDTNAFEKRYDFLLNELRSTKSLSNERYIWSKMYFDHAMYYYNNYKFNSSNNNITEATSSIKTANTITNMAYYILEAEKEVINYYNNADINILIKDNISKEENKENYTNNDSNIKSQNVYVLNRGKVGNFIYILIFLILIVIILLVIEFEKFKKVNNKERIKKQIADIDEKLLEGKISPFTHKELRHRYLEELRNIKTRNHMKKLKHKVGAEKYYRLKANLERQLLEHQMLELQLRHKELLQSEGNLTTLEKPKKPRKRAVKNRKKAKK